ncbi:coenzyme Q-binding protein COQ10, partial [Paragonimus westermani]
FSRSFSQINHWEFCSAATVNSILCRPHSVRMSSPAGSAARLCASSIKGIPNLFFGRNFLTFGTQYNKAMAYKEQRLLGYSQQQMFNIAADVGRYAEFVPWCNESVVLRKTPSGALIVRLGVGFPPLNESYQSTVTLENPGLVKSIAQQGNIFEYLINEWKFFPGLTGVPNTCTVEFSVNFEFKSVLYATVAGLFFDQVVAMMVTSFLDRARILHGPPAIPTQKPQILVSKK